LAPSWRVSRPHPAALCRSERRAADACPGHATATIHGVCVLRRWVADGKFREDLFARIKLWTCELPGLRERTEDIEPNQRMKEHPTA